MPQDCFETSDGLVYVVAGAITIEFLASEFFEAQARGGFRLGPRPHPSHPARSGILPGWNDRILFDTFPVPTD